MRQAVNVIRYLVGILFIFSGLVKANDPLGLSYKMEEFFDLWNEGLAKTSFGFLIHFLEFLRDHSLALSVIMIAFEIIAGVALLIGWRMKIFSWLLLLLTLFFTFLTAYAVYSGKFTNCGCFGDCLPIPPTASFLKDIALTILIIFLFINRKKIIPSFRPVAGIAIMLATTVFSFALQWYVLKYLPIVDCLPYKKGNNISEKMKIPPGARPDSFAIRFVYEKGGKQFEFSPSELPPDLGSYTFKERKDKLIRKGDAEPPIKGFILTSMTDVDSTEAILQYPGHSILYFTSVTENNEWKNGNDLSTVLGTASSKSMPVYALTPNADALKKQFEKIGWTYPIFKLDYTAYRTAARANPTIYLIKKGTIEKKWSLAQMNEALKYIKGLNQ